VEIERPRRVLSHRAKENQDLDRLGEKKRQWLFPRPLRNPFPPRATPSGAATGPDPRRRRRFGKGSARYGSICLLRDSSASQIAPYLSSLTLETESSFEYLPLRASKEALVSTPAKVGEADEHPLSITRWIP
jgi:hypothetical protein